jgi:hypothetical protein
VNRRSNYAGRLFAVVLTTIVVVAGCNSAAPPSFAPFVTPTPTPTMTPLPTPPVTPTPELTPTPLATETPSASPSATEAPSAPAGAACTGTATLQDLLLEAVGKLHFQLYCAVLPKGWFFTAVEYKQPNGGYLKISYKNNRGATINVGEGNFCPAMTCWPVDSTIGAASFGDLPGTLVVADATPIYGVYVDPNTNHSYSIFGKGMTQAQFTAIAAAMIQVPTP